jgi:hypothetical protein
MFHRACFARAALAPALLATACGSGGTTFGGARAYLGWQGSNGGSVVVDADGVPFVFETSNGCAYDEVTRQGPAGFCLTPSIESATGYDPYGPTGCAGCGAKSFGVALTKDPAGSGCIAVLANASATVDVGLQPLAVTQAGGGFDVETTATPSAFAVYWNGVVPGCGGDDVYAGRYAGPVTSTDYTCPAGTFPVSATTCQGGIGVVPATASMVTLGTLAFTVDSAGQIDDDTAKLAGQMTAAGTGTAVVDGAHCTGSGSAAVCQKYEVETATKDASGKWTLGGTLTQLGASQAPVTFSVTQQ